MTKIMRLKTHERTRTTYLGKDLQECYFLSLQGFESGQQMNPGSEHTVNGVRFDGEVRS